MFACEFCDQLTANAEELQSHLLFMHNTTAYICNFCSKTFYDEQTYLEHYKVGHETMFDRHRCPQCSLTYKKYKFLMRHIETNHEIGKLIKCSECGEEFYNKATYKKHNTLKHETGKKFNKCEKCKRSFSSKAYVVLHNRFDHKPNGKIALCKYIKENLKLNDENLLKDLTRCVACNLPFSCSIDLFKHFKMSHTEKKIYKCCQCTKAKYNNRSSLAVHLTYEHGVSWNHKCNVCLTKYNEDVPKTKLRIKPVSGSNTNLEIVNAESFNGNNSTLFNGYKSNIPESTDLHDTNDEQISNLKHNIRSMFHILCTVPTWKLKAIKNNNQHLNENRENIEEHDEVIAIINTNQNSDTTNSQIEIKPNISENINEVNDDSFTSLTNYAEGSDTNSKSFPEYDNLNIDTSFTIPNEEKKHNYEFKHQVLCEEINDSDTSTLVINYEYINDSFLSDNGKSKTENNSVNIDDDISDELHNVDKQNIEVSLAENNENVEINLSEHYANSSCSDLNKDNNEFSENLLNMPIKTTRSVECSNVNEHGRLDNSKELENHVKLYSDNTKQDLVKIDNLLNDVVKHKTSVVSNIDETIQEKHSNCDNNLTIFDENVSENSSLQLLQPKQSTECIHVTSSIREYSPHKETKIDDADVKSVKLISLSPLKEYFCKFCSIKFFNQVLLLNHLTERHTNINENSIYLSCINTVYVCLICGKAFQSDSILEQHIIEDHKINNMFKCHLCDVLVANSYLLKKHFAVEHRNVNTNVYRCDVYKTALNKLESLNEISKSAYVPVVKCEKCNLKLKKTELSSHQCCEQHVCSYCKRCFNTEIDMNKHVSLLHKVINQRKNINYNGIHMANSDIKISSNLKYKCEECKRKFKDDKQLKIHKLNAHKTTKLLHKCLKCDQKFITKEYLLRHIKRRHKIILNKLHKCEICTSVFKYEDKLRQHYKLKHEVKSYLKEKENKKPSPVVKIKKLSLSSLPSNLSDMKYVNVTMVPKIFNEAMYKCESCNSYFPTNDLLERHLKWEHNIIVDSHKCCGKVLLNVEELEHHSINNLHVDTLVNWKKQIVQNYENNV